MPSASAIATTPVAARIDNHRHAIAGLAPDTLSMTILRGHGAARPTTVSMVIAASTMNSARSYGLARLASKATVLLRVVMAAFFQPS
jgi:hypothetical protein